VFTRSLLATSAVVVGSLFSAAPVAHAIDEEHYQMARQMIEKSIEYLRTQQDEATGGWSVPKEGPNIPAITGLVLNGMLMEPDIDHTDPAVAKALEYLYSFQQENGGIYDVILANYNTAITVSALSRVNTAEAGEAIQKAIPFLKRLQWSEDAIAGREDTAVVDRSHPYYGGVGYGGSGRPDNSNLNLMLQALHDAGVDCEDPAFQRALVFLQRTQMLHKDDEGNVINDMPYAEGSQQGGFIYATSPNEDNIGIGESKAGTIEETLSDGTVASRLRAYGSMTYAGFKSYLYANLDRDDPRVLAAYNWLRENYTLEENPGIGLDGYYYFLITMSRAMDAWGEPQIEAFGEPVTLKAVVPIRNTSEMKIGEPDVVEVTALQDQDGRVYELASPVIRVTRVLESNDYPSNVKSSVSTENLELRFEEQLDYSLAGEGPHTDVQAKQIVFTKRVRSPSSPSCRTRTVRSARSTIAGWRATRSSSPRTR